jgi:chromosome segregation protein
MRISKIKLSGFKSFVDPTTIELPGNLTGIVGPNGCGKSNIVDAMQWVLGEMSAKHLRGDSMADVIFNGATTRQPVGLASVELIFDNSDGKIGGQYASYNEISIKRQVGRDGISTYSLNGTHCRRRDIIHLFLGTGIGARTYSVIEQGMISRVIEAKPDELRMFLEEAAGISKYKERRRETENRIHAANENIARINDIRAELDTQLQHLSRQAKSAEKYQQLKQEERQTQMQLHALRWQALKTGADNQRARGEAAVNAVEATLAALRATEAEIARQHEAQIAATDEFNSQQSRYYQISADLARTEQNIQHAVERRQGMEQELVQTRANVEETQRQLTGDKQRLTALTAERQQREPEQNKRQQHEQATAAKVQAAEQAMQEWQTAWDACNDSYAESSSTEQLEQTRLEHLQEGIAQARKRLAALKEEQAALKPTALTSEMKSLQTRFASAETGHQDMGRSHRDLQNSIQELRGEIRTHTEQLDQLRQERQVLRGQLASAEALQQSALGLERPGMREWLTQQGWQASPRLTGAVEVESGWERALEVACPLPLSTLCLPDLEKAMTSMAALAEGRVTALATKRTAAAGAQMPSVPLPALVSKVKAPWPLDDLLDGIYAAEDLATARRYVKSLRAGECIVTRDGIRIGPGWIDVHHDPAQGGLVARAQELQQLQQKLSALETRIAKLSAEFETHQRRLAELEAQETGVRSDMEQSHDSMATLRSELAARRARLDEMETRRQRIENEISELTDQIVLDEEAMERAGEAMKTAHREATRLEKERAGQQKARERLQQALLETRETWKQAHEQLRQSALRWGGVISEYTAVEEAVARNQTLSQRLQDRRKELEQSLKEAVAPVKQLETEREALLKRRVQAEGTLKQAREAVQELDRQLRDSEQRRLTVERELSGRRDELERVRVELSAVDVRLQALQEQVEAAEGKLDEVLAQLPEGAEVTAWEEKLAELSRKVQRLGPINLAAIDEYATLSERKEYLDKQHADLAEALATLAEAIRKIDRETRTRFKETFDKVNSGFQTLFPILFGGGHAYLEMVGEDLLETGVTVMARPPGKRNSTIHLLSGGEKALTAVALVFAIFELNPAPFCLLDEVDAPLDDANVVRLSEMLKQKARDIQFLFITHNKITMEIAGQLIGVTMQEAGVSRLVAVNMEEAVRMAATA